MRSQAPVSESVEDLLTNDPHLARPGLQNDFEEFSSTVNPSYNGVGLRKSHAPDTI